MQVILAFNVFFSVKLGGDNSDEEEDPLFSAIKNKEPNYELQCFQKVSEHCVELIKQLLMKDPDERISIKDALSHEFFQQYDPNPQEELKFKEQRFSQTFKEKDYSPGGNNLIDDFFDEEIDQ